MATLTDDDVVRGHALLTPAQVEAVFPNLTTNLLAIWRCRHVGPKFYKSGRSILYSLDEVEAWILSARR